MLSDGKLEKFSCAKFSLKLHSRFFRRGRKVKVFVGFQRFRIKPLSRAALQTASVSYFSIDKRAADIVVPTTEKRRNQTYFLSENKSVSFIRSFFVNQ